MSSCPAPTDALAAVTHPDPYPFYAALRAAAPLTFEPRLRLWIASRAEVVQEALAHPALRVRPQDEPVPAAIADRPAGALFGQLVRMNDGPVHAALKPLLREALAQADLAAARQATRHAAAALQAAEPALDLNERCMAVPVCAVAALLGFAPPQWPALWQATRAFVAALSPLSTPAQLEAASTAADQLLACVDALSRDGGTPGPASALARLPEQARRRAAPARKALLANLAGLLSQTCEATAALLGNSLVALMRAPRLRDDLAAGRVAADAIVAEVARHDPPTQNTRRFVAGPGPVALAGATLQPGDTVLLVLAAASRDPARWDAPDCFRPGRAPRPLPGFGHGLHACPGQSLALWIAAAALETPRAAGGVAPGPADPPARLLGYRPSVNLRLPVFG